MLDKLRYVYKKEGLLNLLMVALFIVIIKKENDKYYAKVNIFNPLTLLSLVIVTCVRQIRNIFITTIKDIDLLKDELKWFKI